MKRRWAKTLLLIFTVILFFTFTTIKVNAGKAGVGVLNVSPQYNMICLVKHEDTFRIYLTVSDYNSWEDIFSVSIVLEDIGGKKDEFLFKQYEEKTSLYTEKINEFTESSKEQNLLIAKKCSYNRVEGGSTTEDKCNLELLFVFHTTWFTNLNIIAKDRDGKTATLALDYTAEDLIRSGNIIIIPSIGESMVIKIPPYLLDAVALFAAAFGTLYFVRKTNVGKIMSAVYEEN